MARANELMNAVTGKELNIIRIIDAPRELVYKMWTDETHMAKWWGPNGFTNIVCKMDVRPGGSIYIVLLDPEGQENPVKGTFHELSEPGKVVFTTTAFEDEDGKPQVEMLNTLVLEEYEGKTRLHLKAEIIHLSEAMAAAREGMQEGWSESINRMEEGATQIAYADRCIVTSRILNTPVEKVYTAWTTPELIAQWWGPKGFTNTIKTFECITGGNWELTMHDANNRDYHNTWVFEEITPHEKLILNHTSDPKFKATVTFESIANNQTKLTYRMNFATPAEYEAVKAYAPAANEQKFDKLETILAAN
jgi:uncharacterized protein YndB with AHSA1/START domain